MMRREMFASEMNRRQFVNAAAAALVFPRIARGAVAGQTVGGPTIVDTHVHCFAGKDNPRFPYHPRGPYQPAEAATPQHLLECMDGAGVAHAIIVHPEPYQDDHRYLEYCLEVGHSRLKGTCLLFADRPGSLAKMPDLARRLPVVAVRVHAYAPDRLPPFGKPELRALWKMAGENGLAVQLHFEPRHAPGFDPLIREFADTLVIIDHLGRPFQGTPNEHETVLRWSERPNTVIKLSAIPPSTTYPHRDIAPIIKRLLEAYGADRMIYGGGFSAEATGATYRAAIAKAKSYISHISETDQAKILGGNAKRLFKF